MSQFWSKASTDSLLPGLTLVLLLAVGLLFGLSVVLANKGVARRWVGMAWALSVWLSLLFLGASAALWWHDQPFHVWGSTARVGTILSIAMFAGPLIERRFRQSLKTTREPG